MTRLRPFIAILAVGACAYVWADAGFATLQEPTSPELFDAPIVPESPTESAVAKTTEYKVRLTDSGLLDGQLVGPEDEPFVDLGFCNASTVSFFLDGEQLSSVQPNTDGTFTVEGIQPDTYEVTFVSGEVVSEYQVEVVEYEAEEEAEKTTAMVSTASIANVPVQQILELPVPAAGCGTPIYSDVSYAAPMVVDSFAPACGGDCGMPIYDDFGAGACGECGGGFGGGGFGGGGGGGFGGGGALGLAGLGFGIAGLAVGLSDDDDSRRDNGYDGT